MSIPADNLPVGKFFHILSKMDKYERRRQRLLELRDSQCDGNGAELARRIERDGSYVTRMFYPEGKPGKKRIADDMMEVIETAFSLPRGWLDKEPDTEAGPDLRGKVPLISWVQAGNWSDIWDGFQPGDAESWRETTARVSAGAYALRIVGDSMEPAIPRGAVVIVDPAIEATNGRVVVVRQNGDSEATIKRLVIEGGVRFLKPDNPRYPIMEMRTDAVICGVAIKVELDL